MGKGRAEVAWESYRPKKNKKTKLQKEVTEPKEQLQKMAMAEKQAEKETAPTNSATNQEMMHIHQISYQTESLRHMSHS